MFGWNSWIRGIMLHHCIFWDTRKPQVNWNVRVGVVSMEVAHRFRHVWYSPEKNMKNDLGDEALPSPFGITEPSGWMALIFLIVQAFLKLHKNNSWRTVDFDSWWAHATKTDIKIACLRTHCTHHIQPFDLYFKGSLKTFPNQETTKWLKSYLGRVLTHLLIGNFFNEAYGKVAQCKMHVLLLKILVHKSRHFPYYMCEHIEATNIPLTTRLQ